MKNEMAMFCYQCEQTAGGKGCTRMGVCGKDPEVAALQDLLIYQLKGIGFYGQRILSEGGNIDDSVHSFVAQSLFYTLTNVNFDADRFVRMIDRSAQLKRELAERSRSVSSNIPAAAGYQPPAEKDRMIDEGRELGVLSDDLPEDILSLRELVLYGLKGLAAYAHHAEVLGYTDRSLNEFFYRALDFTLGDDHSVAAYVDMALEVGRQNLRCMELLDRANTDRFGNPEPTEVLVTRKKGPFIVVSGHDLYDLTTILEQTEGTGINVYTHGELLPANAYPELKRYNHLIGNYGGAWQDQQKEFDEIPGCVVMTTNCIQKPRESYSDRIFTTGPAGWPEVSHISGEGSDKDFSEVIARARELGGWSEDEKEKRITIGFGHNAVLAEADRIVEAVQEGKISHFFLIGGCDGARGRRSYYEELADTVPGDAIILTLACGKYRFNKKDFGTVAGLPRLLDVGQCNDAHSAIRVASALAEAFDCDVNELPLSLVLSWYEQKAVSILLSLFALDIRGIRLGPTLPAFVSPGVLDALVENFDVQPTTTPEEDLEALLG